MEIKKSKRRSLREKALQVLYAYELNGEGLSYLIKQILTDISESADHQFCEVLINKVVGHRKFLDDQIQERVDNWEMERIALIDRLLLRIGIAELHFFPEIPPKVSINEVIEIAKDYSTSNSGKFINGILDSVLTDLKESGELNKTGRGLIDESLHKKPE